MLKEGFSTNLKEKTMPLGLQLRLLHMMNLLKPMAVKVTGLNLMEVDLKLRTLKQLDVSEVFRLNNKIRISI